MLSKSETKIIKSLNKKKFRKVHKLFIIEGERIVHDAIINNADFEQIFISQSFTEKDNNEYLIGLITKNNIPTEAITDAQMKSISDTVSPSGVLAVCKIPDQKEFTPDNNTNYLYLDCIQDPGNLGTLLRSANWFGIKNVALSENSIDIYNPKVLRGGMGAQFSLNIFTDIPLKLLSNHNILGAFQDGENINSINIKSIEPWVLIIGNEANGIGENNINLVDKKITIPKIGSGESLNAAIAGSILMYQLTASLLSD